MDEQLRIVIGGDGARMRGAEQMRICDMRGYEKSGGSKVADLQDRLLFMILVARSMILVIGNRW